MSNTSAGLDPSTRLDSVETSDESELIEELTDEMSAEVANVAVDDGNVIVLPEYVLIVFPEASLVLLSRVLFESVCVLVVVAIVDVMSGIDTELPEEVVIVFDVNLGAEEKVLTPPIV